MLCMCLQCELNERIATKEYEKKKIFQDTTTLYNTAMGFEAYEKR